MSKFKIWLDASRPKTLWAAIAPVILGSALAAADNSFYWPAAFIALIGAVLIQIGTNFANDYFDFLKGADAGPRLGPTRATQAKQVTPAQMRLAFILVFALAILIGIYLVWRGGWPVVVIGLASIFFGILYTATPYALAYLGIADLFVLIFFGPIAVGGTYYVQTLTITLQVLIAGLAPGFISMAILVVNNLRDIENDRKAGKMTLAVRLGKRFTQIEYIFCLLLACLIPAGLIIFYEAPLAILAVFLILPAGFNSIKIVFQPGEGKILNNVLAGTGKLLLFYCLLFSLALTFSG
ncbi:MAG: 1,4-dihydroxy-2-naphthoate polyprenyltransferase [Calditrichaeota bacterium]|nr:MAG: 1,4-dihydroxy-2-naphthoate polyprenyltransferase [Calditrichota bacterium]